MRVTGIKALNSAGDNTTTPVPTIIFKTNTKKIKTNTNPGKQKYNSYKTKNNLYKTKNI